MPVNKEPLSSRGGITCHRKPAPTPQPFTLGGDQRNRQTSNNDA